MLSVIAIATFILLDAVTSSEWKAIDLGHPIILPRHPELDGDVPITSQSYALLPSYRYVSRSQIEHGFGISDDVVTWAELMVQIYSDVIGCATLGHNPGESASANESSQQHGIVQIMSKDDNRPDDGWKPISVQSCLIENCIRDISSDKLAQVMEHNDHQLLKSNQDPNLRPSNLEASSRLVECGATEQVGDYINNPASPILNCYPADDIIRRSGQQSECGGIDGCKSAPENDWKGVSCTSQQRSWSNSSYNHAHSSDMVNNLPNNVHIIDWDSLCSTDDPKLSDNPVAQLNDHSLRMDKYLPPHLRPTSITDSSRDSLDIDSSGPRQSSPNHASPINTISKVDDNLTPDQPILDSIEPIIIDWELSSSSSHDEILFESKQANPGSGDSISLDEYFPTDRQPGLFVNNNPLDIYRPGQDNSFSRAQPLIPVQVNCNVGIDDYDYEQSAVSLPPSPQRLSSGSIPVLDDLKFSPYPEVKQLPINMPVLSHQSVSHHGRSFAFPESNRFQRVSISNRSPTIPPRSFPSLSSSNTESPRQVYAHGEPVTSLTRARYSASIIDQSSVCHSAVDRRSVDAQSKSRLPPSQGYLKGGLNQPSSDITAQRSYHSNQEIMTRYAGHASYVTSQEFQRHSGIYHSKQSPPVPRSHRGTEPLRHSVMVERRRAEWRQHPKAIAMLENWRTDPRSTLLSTYPRHSQNDQESVQLSQLWDRRNKPGSLYETPSSELGSRRLYHDMYYGLDRDDRQKPPKIVVYPGYISDITVGSTYHDPRLSAASDLSIRRQRSRPPSSNNPRPFIPSVASDHLVKVPEARKYA